MLKTLFSDTVFFHLPGKGASEKTVYCVSCYRQIDAKVICTEIVTASSEVMKASCLFLLSFSLLVGMWYFDIDRFDQNFMLV